MNVRLRRVVDKMQHIGVEALVVGPGADLEYLTGYVAEPSERLTALLLLPDTAELYLPMFEAPRVASSDARLRPWSEDQDPVLLIAAQLRQRGVRSVAVGDHLWSRFLLGLQRGLPAVRWSPASEILTPLRLIKSGEEIELMRQAGAAADRVWGRIRQSQLEGRTEREVARELSELLIAEGLDGAAFTIVGSGPNSASPHHSPSDRVLQEGDMVVLDYGGPLHGYNSDITRTLHIGPATDEERRVYEAVREAQERAVQAVKPGATCGSVDATARDYLESAGLGEYFTHRTGHGLGLEVHEPPYILAASDQTLERGMVFSIEPGVYIPDQFGVRIEDIVVVTEDGGERLNHADRSLVEL